MKLYRLSFDIHLLIVDRKNDKYVILNPSEDYSRCVPLVGSHLIMDRWPHLKPPLKVFLNRSYPDIRSTKTYFMTEIPQYLEEQFLDTNNPQPIFDWYRQTIKSAYNLQPIVKALRVFVAPLTKN